MILSSDCRPCAGVRQGCIISALSFNAYSELIITLEDCTDDITIDGYRTAKLRYADVAILFATSAQQQAEELLLRMERASHGFRFKINRSKT